MRWLGRATNAAGKTSDLWLDVEVERRWYTVGLCLPKPRMRGLEKLLARLAPAELLLERHRPNNRRGPLQAAPATQDLQGAWILDEPVKLYLTPGSLVVLQDDFVQHRLSLGDIKHVEALPRLDAPLAAGLIRFEYKGDVLAFALNDYQDFALLVADSSGETLERPTFWKRREDP
jgi:hypothetical protein